MWAPTILGVQDNSLSGRSQPFGVVEPDRPTLIEDRKIVVSVASQPDDVCHRQQAAAAGKRLAGTGF
jgi:hypothetical protein